MLNKDEGVDNWRKKWNQRSYIIKKWGELIKWARKKVDIKTSLQLSEYGWGIISPILHKKATEAQTILTAQL